MQTAPAKTSPESASATATAAAESADYESSIRAWERETVWWRRYSGRLGLQGKLLLSFMALLSLALGSSCAIFLSQSEARLQDIIGEQAQQLATALAVSTEDTMASPEFGHAKLRSTASNVIKGRNIVLVAFYDPEGKAILQRSRDPDIEARTLDPSGLAAQELLRIHRRSSHVFGEYLEVIAPVLSSPRSDTGSAGPARLFGYVTVGLSAKYESSQINRINIMVVGVGCFVAFLSLPMAYLLVHRVFLPIRQLVGATKKIIGGDLDARVAIHRPDVIGDLARAFNEMVVWVKKEQQDVALANSRLAEANRDLEVKIEHRTGQLEAANKRLSTEIAEKEDFLRAVSHDLNAPLRNISGMATMLLMKNRDKFDEDVIHRLERIKSNVDVETSLIGELLELSRIKTRRQKMELVDINELINELGDIFENDLKSRDIGLIIDSPLPTLNCERARMRQVFQNLIDNAIKYMGNKDKREIHVGCHVKLTEAEFYVRDTGLGIDPEDIDKVFFIFRRGKNLAQNIAGKGVGLASVKSIIETYNGRIWVESKLGAGSTFKFAINGMYVPSAGKDHPHGRQAKVAASRSNAA